MDKKVKRFIAGEKLADAISKSKKLNKLGIHSTISHLGENIKIKKQCTDSTFSYLKIINQISKNQLNASVSIKLSQIGFVIDQKFCIKNLQKILKNSSKSNVFIWIEAENYKYLKKTLNIFKHFSKIYTNLGIILHANIKGTGTILENLILQKAKIRLDRGPYRDKTEATFQSNFQIESNFIKLENILFQKSDNFEIATHDLKSIKIAIKLQHTYKKNFQFQFLMGVRLQLEKDLLNSGYRVSEYVPYGKEYDYIRRLEEQNLHMFG